MRSKLIVLLLVIAVTMFPIACGEDSATDSDTDTETGEAAPIHQLPQETVDKLLSDATADLELIASADADSGVLSQAMMGKALEDMKATFESDLAQGRYRKRDYQNIQVSFQEYMEPVAGVYVEFDETSSYVDVDTGEVLEALPTEHRTYSLAMEEEDGRWKISLILLPMPDSETTSNGETTNEA